VILATVAAICVLTVLITPAFDELPTTIPHIFHGTAALPPAIGAQLLRVTSESPQADPTTARILSVADQLSLTCTRLC
jgi:hypothetical protein